MTRHAEAADEEQDGDEDVDLPGQADPLRVGQRRAADAQHVGQPDDDHQGGVFEQAHEGDHDAGQRDLQGLRRHDEENGQTVPVTNTVSHDDRASGAYTVIQYD